MDTFTREFAMHLAAEDAKREVAAGFAKLRYRLWLLDLQNDFLRQDFSAHDYLMMHPLRT